MNQESLFHDDCALDDVDFIIGALGHRLLNVLELPGVADNAFDVDLARRDSIDGHWIDVPVSEDGLEVELLVKSEAHGQCDVAAWVIADKDDRTTLSSHADGLSRGNVSTRSLDDEVNTTAVS